MATRRIPVQVSQLGAGVGAEPAALNFLANDRHGRFVLTFPDGASKITVGVKFMVPHDYVGTPKLGINWGTTATSGDVVWDADLKAIADAESFDPSTDDDAATVTTTAPGTARLRKESLITLTGTYAAGDEVRGNVGRDLANAADTMAATAYVEGMFFEYSNS